VFHIVESKIGSPLQDCCVGALLPFARIKKASQFLIEEFSTLPHSSLKALHEVPLQERSLKSHIRFFEISFELFEVKISLLHGNYSIQQRAVNIAGAK